MTFPRYWKPLAVACLFILLLVVAIIPVMMNGIAINASGLATYDALVRPGATSRHFFRMAASRIGRGAGMENWYRYWALGKMHLAMGDYVAAVHELALAAEGDPGTDAWLSIDLLNAYDRVGITDRFITRYEETRETIDALVQPCRSKDEGCRGMAILERGGYEPSDPASIDRVALNYFYEARRIWQTGGDSERALALLQKARGIRPDDLHAIYLEARIHEALGRDAETAASVESLRFFRVQPWLDPRLGSLLVETAIELVEKGVWDQSQTLDYASVLAWQHPSDASTDRFLQAMLQRHPEDPDWLLLLGELHQRRGELAEARRAYLHVMELSPDHPAASLALRQMDLGSVGSQTEWNDKHNIAAFLEVSPGAFDVGPNLLDEEVAGMQSPVDVYLDWAPRGVWRVDVREKTHRSEYAPASFVVGFDELGYGGEAIRIQGFWTQDQAQGPTPWAGMWTNAVKLKPQTLYVLSFAYKASGVGSVHFPMARPAVLDGDLTLRPTDGRWRKVVIIGANWTDRTLELIPIFRTFTRGQVLFEDIELRELIPHQPWEIPPASIIRYVDLP